MTIKRNQQQYATCVWVWTAVWRHNRHVCKPLSHLSNRWCVLVVLFSTSRWSPRPTVQVTDSRVVVLLSSELLQYAYHVIGPYRKTVADSSVESTTAVHSMLEPSESALMQSTENYSGLNVLQNSSWEFRGDSWSESRLCLYSFVETAVWWWSHQRKPQSWN